MSGQRSIEHHTPRVQNAYQMSNIQNVINGGTQNEVSYWQPDYRGASTTDAAE